MFKKEELIAFAMLRGTTTTKKRKFIIELRNHLMRCRKEELDLIASEFCLSTHQRKPRHRAVYYILDKLFKELGESKKEIER